MWESAIEKYIIIIETHTLWEWIAPHQQKKENEEPEKMIKEKRYGTKKFKHAFSGFKIMFTEKNSVMRIYFWSSYKP